MLLNSAAVRGETGISLSNSSDQYMKIMRRLMVLTFAK